MTEENTRQWGRKIGCLDAIVRFRRSGYKSQDRAFTLVEAVFAAAILGMLAAATFTLLTVMNRVASVNRVRTQATVVAQNQIDSILTAGPFGPQLTPVQVPTILTPGSVRQDNVAICTDPDNNAVTVLGSVTTTVTSLGTPLNVHRAVVDVDFAYRNRLHRIQLSTLRSPD